LYAYPSHNNAASSQLQFHVRVPLRTFYENDLVEWHTCAAEAAVLAALRPAEANSYVIDVVQNDEIRRSFMATKNQMATSGKVREGATLYLHLAVK
jgi:hypothetical protein